MVSVERPPCSCRLALFARQILHFFDFHGHGLDICRVPRAGPVRLQRFPLALEDLVQLAQGLVARQCMVRFLSHFPPMSFYSGNEIGDIVACDCVVHGCS
jgi:hypothetical protein